MHALELIIIHQNWIVGQQKHITTVNHAVDYSDVTMGTMASQITSLTIVYPIVYSGANQTKHQSPASLAFVKGIYWWPVNSPHKGPVTPKIFPFDDVIMPWGLQNWDYLDMNMHLWWKQLTEYCTVSGALLFNAEQFHLKINALSLYNVSYLIYMHMELFVMWYINIKSSWWEQHIPIAVL